MQSVDVVLDGESYTIQEKRSRENREWRALLEGHFSELAAVLEDAPDVDVTDGQALARLVRNASGKLLRSVDILGELLVAYAPQVQDVVGEAYDSEILEAFTAVLGLAYPFGSVIGRIRQIGSRLDQM